MNRDLKVVLQLIENMWYYSFEEGNGATEFDVWCEDNLENEEQVAIRDSIKEYVDKISFKLGNLMVDN